jgi:exopolysaccharide biosynthesis protein
MYGLAKDGHLKSFDTRFGEGKNYTLGNALVKQYIEDIYEIKNTFAFRPVLVQYGKNQYTENNLQYLTSRDWRGNNMRQAICQIDKNNFVLITSTSKDRDHGLSLSTIASMMIDMGCYTGFNLDGGGSTSYFYKSNAADLVGPLSQHESNRISGEVIYFVEQ